VAERPSAAPTATASADGQDKKSMMPVLLGGGVILAVFALIAFWPSDKGDGTGANADKGAAEGEDGPGGSKVGAGKGGVQARDYDEPSAPTRPGKRNPAVRLPNVGMSPEAPAPEEAPPVFASKAEEIAWYERKLEKAKELRDARQKFADRLPRVKEKIESSPNPDQQMQAFEKRKKIVEENYAKAQADVAELEKKLAELKGG